MKLRGDRCQCPTCKLYFTTTRNFDKHRVGKYTDQSRRCVHPSEVGLVQRPDGFWSMPPNPRRSLSSRARSGDLAEGVRQ